MKPNYFTPKSQCAKEMERRFPDADLSPHLKILGFQAEPMPFRCSQCQTRPAPGFAEQGFK